MTTIAQTLCTKDISRPILGVLKAKTKSRTPDAV